MCELTSFFPLIFFVKQNLFLNPYRFDCHPEDDVTEKKCEQRGCCWNGSGLGALRSTPLNVPYCYYPQGYYLYQRILSEDLGQKIIHSFRNIKPSGFPGDISNVCTKY